MLYNSYIKRTDVVCQGSGHSLDLSWHYDYLAGWGGPAAIPGSSGITSSAPAIVHNTVLENTEIAVEGP
jgi:hypothetical protein